MEDTDVPAPRSTGKVVDDVVLTGCLIPYKEGNPVAIQVPGSHFVYVACFENVQTLEAFALRTKITYDAIKQIVDGEEFLEDIKKHAIVKVMYNPWFTEEGKSRWLEIKGFVNEAGERKTTIEI